MPRKKRLQSILARIMYIASLLDRQESIEANHSSELSEAIRQNANGGRQQNHLPAQIVQSSKNDVG
jgi:hypothetical protein